MKRGKDTVKAVGNDIALFHAAFVGADTANATLATAAQFPKICNLGVTLTRTSIGLYVCTLSDTTPQILNVIATVMGPTTLTAEVVVQYSVTNKTFSLNFWNKAATVALADPQTTDIIVITLVGRDSTG